MPVPTLRLAVALVVLACACGKSQDTAEATAKSKTASNAAQAPEPPPLSDAAKRGEPLYQRHCEGCHGADGKGHPIVADKLDPRPRDLTTGVFKFGTTRPGSLPSDADLARTITQSIYWSSMHPTGPFSSDDMNAMVQYIKHFAVHRDPATGAWLDPFAAERLPIDVPKGPEDTPALRARGRTIYATACAGCHGMSGTGDGPVAPTLLDQWGGKLAPRDLTVPVYKVGSTAPDVFVTITRGIPGTPMPPMMHLGASDRWAISDYVVSLQGLPKDLAKRGEVLFEAYGCVDCHGAPGAGGIINPNSVKGRTPDLGELSERLFLYEPEDIDAFVSLLQANDALEGVEPPDIPRWPAVLAQYESVRQVIAGGAQSGQEDPNGEAPTMNMPSWQHRLSSLDTRSILVYLLLRGKEEEEDDEE